MKQTCTMECGPKCMISGLLAAAFMAGALWMIVTAVLKQTVMYSTMHVLLWYFGGFLLFAIARYIKMKSCTICSGR